MHGIIFRELRKFVETTYPSTSWDTLLADAGLPGKLHYSIQLYPDTEAAALITALVKRTGKPEKAILREFGQFVQPTLLLMYTTLADPQWRTLDILEHTEDRFHATVIQRHGAAPPRLECVRLGPQKVRVVYASKRKMCALAEGVIIGLGRHFHENVVITHDVCIHKGSAHCEIDVTVLPF